MEFHGTRLIIDIVYYVEALLLYVLVRRLRRFENVRQKAARERTPESKLRQRAEKDVLTPHLFSTIATRFGSLRPSIGPQQPFFSNLLAFQMCVSF
jgi:hypothetical protein